MSKRRVVINQINGDQHETDIDPKDEHFYAELPFTSSNVAGIEITNAKADDDR